MARARSRGRGDHSTRGHREERGQNQRGGHRQERGQNQRGHREQRGQNQRGGDRHQERLENKNERRQKKQESRLARSQGTPAAASTPAAPAAIVAPAAITVPAPVAPTVAQAMDEQTMHQMAMANSILFARFAQQNMQQAMGMTPLPSPFQQPASQPAQLPAGQLALPAPPPHDSPAPQLQLALPAPQGQLALPAPPPPPSALLSGAPENRWSSQARLAEIRIREAEYGLSRESRQKEHELQSMKAKIAEMEAGKLAEHKRREARSRLKKLTASPMLLAAQLRHELRDEAEGVFNQNVEELRNVEHTRVPNIQQAAYRAVRRVYHLAILRSIQQHHLNLDEDHTRVQNTVNGWIENTTTNLQNMVNSWTEDTTTNLETELRSRADTRRSELTSAIAEANRDRESLNRWVSEGGMPPDEWLYMPDETPFSVQQDANQGTNITMVTGTGSAPRPITDLFPGLPTSRRAIELVEDANTALAPVTNDDSELYD